MKWRERMLCGACAPRKLIEAEMTFNRKPADDNIAVCAFCGKERPCKCYRIATEKDR